MRLITRCPECRLFLKHDSKGCKNGHKIGKHRVYYAEYMVNGKRKREKLCYDFKTAMISLVEIEKSIIEGKYGIKKQMFVNFNTLCDFYLSLEETKTKKTYKSQIRPNVLRLSRSLGDRIIEDTFRDAFNDYISERAEYLKPATVNRDLSLVRAIIEVGVRYGKVFSNPISCINQLREDNERIVTVSNEDVVKLITLSDRRIRKAIYFASLHTIRLNEIYLLTWDMVDLKNGWVTIPGSISKNGKTRKLPIMNKVEMIQYKTRPGGGNVFDLPAKSTFSKLFKHAREFAGLDDLHFHDLRHYAANRLKEKGHSVEDIMKWAGWSSMSMYHRYTLSGGENGVFEDKILAENDQIVLQK